VARRAAGDDGESPELRAEVEEVSAERLVFFSDAVVAIAITLLALELPLPSAPGGGAPTSATTNHEFLVSLQANADQYLAFLISFVVIAAHWRGHHWVFRYVRSVGPILRWNMLWLLFIVVTPFATRVLNEDGGFEVRFILYAAVQVLASVSFLGILWGISRNDLLRPGSPPGLVRSSAVRLGGLAVTFLLSIPLAFVTRYAYFVWFAIPFAAVAIRRLTKRFAPAAREEPPQTADG
jgi:uncharacterized membrane protein